MQSNYDRFRSLDVLRGVAAIAVIFWHWQHFGYVGTQFTEKSFVAYPAYGFLRLFYEYGSQAVDLFFCLSGFIFYWLYAREIAKSPGLAWHQFAILRFSRLYPLHICTLVFVLVFQQLIERSIGTAFLFQWNDTYHFLLNVFFVQSLGLENGLSFNAPSWSISVEVFLYSIFYLLLRTQKRVSIGSAVVLIAIGQFIGYFFYSPVGRGLVSFFTGGLVFIAYNAASGSSRARSLATWSLTIAAILWIATILFSAPVFGSLGSIIGTLANDLHPRAGWALERLIIRGYGPYVLFPLTIFALAMNELMIRPNLRRFTWLGDASYSIYMWHFPLQLVTYYVLSPQGGVGQLHHAPVFLLVFVVATLAVAWLSFNYLEKPSQKLIRQRLGVERK